MNFIMKLNKDKQNKTKAREAIHKGAMFVYKYSLSRPVNLVFDVHYPVETSTQNRDNHTMKTKPNQPSPTEDDVLRRMLATPPKPSKKPPAPAK